VNKFIGQIKKGAEKATAEATKLRQQMVIKSSIDALRAKANERTRELGELVLAQHRGGKALEPEELSICQDIDTIEAEIVQKNEELKALKEEPAAPLRGLQRPAGASARTAARRALLRPAFAPAAARNCSALTRLSLCERGAPRREAARPDVSRRGWCRDSGASFFLPPYLKEKGG